MRLRKIKNAQERLQINDNKFYIADAIELKGKWKELFGNNNPIHIEIGCGKGQFISTLAKLNPDINYIAIEKYDSVLLRTLEKVIESDLENLRLINIDALELSNYFDSKEVNTIYLNFSDPWPKNHHAKRRLTSPLFLEQYKKVLDDNGVLIQKTDNRHLFEYSLESFSQNGWYLSNIYLDLHKEEVFNITTEYEDKWSQKGPIYKLEARLYKEGK